MVKEKFVIPMVTLLSMTIPGVKAQSSEGEKTEDKLVVVWTSGDPNVAEKVALMYTHNAKKKGWFQNVTLVIWGPSAKLISENVKLQEEVELMKKDGVVVEACIACANAYGVTEELKNLGYDVKGMGLPLTEYLKTGVKVLTF
jgi:Uncharacterized protein conserved in archaea